MKPLRDVYPVYQRLQRARTLDLELRIFHFDVILAMRREADYRRRIARLNARSR